MKIRNNKSKYTIVDVGYWHHHNNKHINIIKSFLEEDDVLLFEYFKADPYYWDAKFIQEQKDSDYEMFINNYYEFHFKATKEKVLKEINHILYECVDIDNKDDLLNKFLLQELLLPKSVLDRIKDIIYIAVDTEENPNLKKFISERKYISDNRVINLKKKVTFSSEPKVSVTWFEAMSDEDIKTAIDFFEFYTCAIVKKGENLDEFRYILNFYETSTNYNINIYEKKNGDFKFKVYPKIKDL